MDARRFSLVWLAAGVGVIAGAPAAAEPVTPVRATLTAAARPRAVGVFVARLSGRTLRWRLTFNGLAAPASAAHVHLAATGAGGPVAVTLCAPCASGATGSVPLSSSTAPAVRGRQGRVDVHSPDVTIQGRIVIGTVPTLQLIGIADGATLRLPARLPYVVTGFGVGAGAGRIAASMGDGTEIALESGTPGVVILPDDKRLTGRRDLTFGLARADGTGLANREARVTVYRVLLIGRR